MSSDPMLTWLLVAAGAANALALGFALFKRGRGSFIAPPILVPASFVLMFGAALAGAPKPVQQVPSVLGLGVAIWAVRIQRAASASRAPKPDAS
jgi:hypothetical protein